MKILFDLTSEIAEAASVSSPTPPLYNVVFSIYKQLGGSQNGFPSIYDTLQAMLDEGLVSGGGGITPSGSLEILTNGIYNVTQYASASVSVPQGVFPEGTVNITENGEYEVRNYDSASINVPQPEGSVSISENGNYDVAQYASASISVPQGIFPSGNLSITENGNYNVENFVSTSVNVPQGVFPSGNLNITENGNYEVAGYESASVSIQGGGGSVFDDLTNAGYSAAQISELETDYSSEIEIAISKSLNHQLNWDNFQYYFSPDKFNGYHSTIIPAVDTSNGTDFSRMFFCNGCVYVPLLNTSKGTNFNNMFAQCYGLKTIPAIDTSNGTNFSSMFYYCKSLESVPKLNFSKATSVSSIFNTCPYLKNVGGFTGLSINISLSSSPLLTRQSVINILTEAADLTGQTGATLTLHADAKARLTQAEYDLAASKNWTIA